MESQRVLPKLKHSEITDKVLAAFYLVYNTLGYGFLEKVYRNALAHELRKQGCKVETEQRIQVYYDGVLVGEYVADLVIDDKVIVELKSAEAISEAHIAQLVNYLQATQFEVGLLLNFGPKPTFERRVWSNHKKPHFKSIQ